MLQQLKAPLRHVPNLSCKNFKARLFFFKNNAVRYVVVTLLATIVICSALTVVPVKTSAKHLEEHIRVGIFSFPPFNYIDDKGVAKGLNPDLLREIASGENWTLEYVPGSFSECLSRLQNEEIDLMLSVAYSPERENIMDYTYESVAGLWGQVFIRSGEGNKNITDLSGRQVGIMSSDINGDNFKKTAAKLGVTCKIREFPTYHDVFTAVRKGKIDAGVAPHHYGLRHSAKHDLVASTIMFSPFSIHFTTRKGTHQELLSHINARLSEWKGTKSSFYYKRMDHWLGAQQTSQTIPLWITYIGFISVAIALLFAGFTLLLRKTVQKRTRELKEREERFRNITEATFEGYALASEELIIDSNPQLAEMLGYTQAEFVGTKLLYLFTPESATLVKHHIRTNHPTPYEATAVKKDGTEFPIELYGKQIEHRGQTVRQTIIRDLTQQKQMIELLTETKNELTTVFDNIPMITLLIGRDLKIRKANRFALSKRVDTKGATEGKTSGYPLGCQYCLEGDSRCGHASECSTCLLQKTIATTFDSGKPLDNIETLISAKRGSTTEQVTYLLSTVPLTISDRHFVLLTAQDITEYKEMEHNLMQSYKMEAIGTLAGGIAHDFNNLLSLIIGFTEMAQDDAVDNPECTTNLDQTLSAANKAKKLVEQILAFSRRADVEKFCLNPATLIKEWLTMLRSSLPTTIEIEQDIDSNCGTILADATQLQQVFMNLCTNAFHAMEGSGGKLTVGLKRSHLQHSKSAHGAAIEPGDYIVLTIGDTGTGISPSCLNNIFDPYFTTKAKGKGTGMGLAITHSIIADYGGTITVDSIVEIGTTFEVFIPVIEQAIQPEKKHKTGVDGGSERILFIDDEPGLAQIGKNMLEKSGYHVTAITDSNQALKLFRENPEHFDLVITDQTMPNMTGADLAHQLLQTRKNLPIILCTGYSSIMSEEEARTLGIREFALKPLKKNELRQLVRRTLDSSEAEH
jgi:PAS domain S-box-containing protein